MTEIPLPPYSENTMNDDLPKKIGPYPVISQIGKGGMGEVYLVQDPDFDREIALKRIRPELMKHVAIKHRFLREARLTAQLTHPGIISIHTIKQESQSLYYLMPYIPGRTLKVILKDAFQKPHLNESQISKLLPIFYSLCQTVGYAHSRGIIHRDIKPENVLVGNFGEVILLDWGLAQKISEIQESEDDIDIDDDVGSLTRPGKMVGTVNYMAPERAFGAPPSFSTDIYALGVILYQILTLKFPFKRGSVKEFCRFHEKEILQDPEEAAPYRDVPPALSQIVKKCLAKDSKQRYLSMESLLRDLESHIEGNSSWFFSKHLSIRNKKHWQFHEHIMISRHTAIVELSSVSEWFGVMFSRTAFAEKMRIEAKVTLKKGSKGLGLVIGTPDLKKPDEMMLGYSLWLGAEGESCVQLYRNTVEVMRLAEVSLKSDKKYEVVIERGDNHIRFQINGGLFYHHISYIPLFGTHLGIIYKDMDFDVEDLNIFVGSHDLEVSCLSVPNAFLASRDLKKALSEFRRISRAFPGHQEGREALFRAGYTLIEQGKQTRDPVTSERAFYSALDEFSSLHGTAGAPLEYLGKALVYQTLKDPQEELKALELGLRRYKHHPLSEALKEHIIFRMHQASQKERQMTYQLIILVLRLIPQIVDRKDSMRLFKDLIAHWEPLPFLESIINLSELSSMENLRRFLISLAFWTASAHILEELYYEVLEHESEESPEILGDILFCLYEMGSYSLAKKLKSKINRSDFPPDLFILLDPLDLLHEKGIKEASELFLSFQRPECTVRELRTLSYLMRFAINQKEESYVHELAKWSYSLPVGKQERIEIDSYRIWAYLARQELKQAQGVFDLYPLELVNQETTLMHPLFGCLLDATEGEEVASIHFNGVTETPFPRSWALLGHEIANGIQEQPLWYQNAFMWEKRALFAQLSLYHSVRNEKELGAYYTHLEKKEWVNESR